jgi:RNA polymerase sigma-70 factor (ECF subfamily)
VNELVRRARAGDEAAFRAIYDAHAGRVHAFCLRFEHDPAVVEELVQDTFVQAWRGLSRFRGEAALSTWLLRIAINAMLQFRRATARRLARVQPTDALELLGASTPAPAAGLRLDLVAALGALAPGARAVFLLHEVEGYTHEEIAEMTGVTVGTCKTQLHRARRRLREALQ